MYLLCGVDQYSGSSIRMYEYIVMHIYVSIVSCDAEQCPFLMLCIYMTMLFSDQNSGLSIQVCDHMDI